MKKPSVSGKCFGEFIVVLKISRFLVDILPRVTLPANEGAGGEGFLRNVILVRNGLQTRRIPFCYFITESLIGRGAFGGGQSGYAR